MMTVVMELAPEIEQMVKTKAQEKGISIEDYLPALVAQAVHQQVWDEDDASLATIAGSEEVMRRLWDTPEEDEAWKHL